MSVDTHIDEALEQPDEEIKREKSPKSTQEKGADASPGATKKNPRKNASEKNALKSAPSGQASGIFYMHAAFLFGTRLLSGMLDFYNNYFGLSPSDKLKIYRNVGNYYMRKGMHQKAIESLKEWVRMDRDNTEANYQLALALATTGKVQGAIIVFDRVLKLDPSHSSALYRKCKLLIKAKEYQEAVVGLESIHATSPHNADVLYHLGLAYSRLEEIDKAIEAVKKAVEISPEESKYYQHLGFLYERAGSHQDAAACFSKVMELEEQREEEDELDS